MTVSLTDREIEMILQVSIEYIEIFGEAEGTSECTKYMIDTGLGSAIRKIGKGKNVEDVYSAYRTVKTYPTFDEWKANRTKSEEDNDRTGKRNEET